MTVETAESKTFRPVFHLHASRIFRKATSMWFKTGTRSIVALVMVLAVSNTAVARGRRGVVYVYPQQVNRSFTPIQQFPHDDALRELQYRADTGSRGLPQLDFTDTQNRLFGMEQRNSISVVVTRESGDVRAGGLLLAMAPQIAAAMLGIIKQIEESPAQESGVEKANAIIAALLPFLNPPTAQNQTVVTNPNAAASTPNVAAATAVPNVSPSTVKVTEELLALKASLITLKATLKEYKEDQDKQKVLQEKVKAALKKVADELKEVAPK